MSIPYLEPLPEAQIEFKIDVNKKEHGYSLKKFKDLLEKELRDFERSEIRAKIQAQSLREQIAYIDKKIGNGEE